MRFRRRRRTREVITNRYSRWDGSQKGFELNADDLFGQMLDDLVNNGDPTTALRNRLQFGFEDANGEQIQGLREMLERLREAREQRLEEHDLGGVFSEIAEALEDVVEQERQSLADLAQLAELEEDERRRELTQNSSTERNLQLDMLPNDLAGKVKGLENYDFTSGEAQEKFEELLDQLREQLMQQVVDQMSDAVDGVTPEDMQRMKDMMAALNEMLEQRQNGEEPDFAKFMEDYGDFFPENPETLDELLEAIAQRMAAMQAMMNSMTPAQRDQLMQLSNQLMDDMDLQWQMQQLGQNLQQMFPQAGWEQSYDFEGADPLDFSSAMDVMGELADIEQLEQMLRGTPSPGALAEVDPERIRDLLGDESAESMERLSEMAKMLEDAGLIEHNDGSYELTPRAIRKMGQHVLGDLFRKLDMNKLGKHDLEQSGTGHERDFDTKPYEYGDPFNLNIERTVRNAVTRSGGGTPVRLVPDDFEIERTEQTVRSATVLMLDLSLSMEMRGNFVPAKKTVMALHALISSQYPRDYLGVVTFSDVAREVKPEKLPQASWDYVYGTNMQHGFQLARRMLARETGTKQIMMITDGEPTAHLTPSGQPFFSYPPSQETVDLTMLEVARCTKDDIRINTFMLDATSYLTHFIETITKMNGGRAFFTTNENIGDYLLVDFVEHKRTMRHGRRAS